MIILTVVHYTFNIIFFTKKTNKNNKIIIAKTFSARKSLINKCFYFGRNTKQQNSWKKLKNIKWYQKLFLFKI